MPTFSITSGMSNVDGGSGGEVSTVRLGVERDQIHPPDNAYRP
jgi:hypothetical protein